jgi:hypothetical protein
VSAGAGNPGGQTTFEGTTYSANGGSGGTSMIANATTILTAAGGAGGAAGATGNINIPGDTGGSGYRMSGTLAISGVGGASLYCAQKSPSVYAPTASGGIAGIAGVLYGGGGSGAAVYRAPAGGTPSAAGGDGAAGVIIIREYK